MRAISSNLYIVFLSTKGKMGISFYEKWPHECTRQQINFLCYLYFLDNIKAKTEIQKSTRTEATNMISSHGVASVCYTAVCVLQLSQQDTPKSAVLCLLFPPLFSSPLGYYNQKKKLFIPATSFLYSSVLGPEFISHTHTHTRSK